jgi:curved DNA-binding protein CbpA
MVWHPDRFAGQMAAMRKRAEKRTQEINEAREILIAHLKKPASANQKSKSKHNKIRTKDRPPAGGSAKFTYRDDGPHDSHDGLGRLQGRTFYKNNEALRFERYYEHGSLYQKGSLKNGELHGPFERFDETGRAVEKGHMNMGKRCGKWWWRSEASDEWVLKKTHRPCVGPSAERYKD